MTTDQRSIKKSNKTKLVIFSWTLSEALVRNTMAGHFFSPPTDMMVDWRIKREDYQNCSLLHYVPQLH